MKKSKQILTHTIPSNLVRIIILNGYVEEGLEIY